MPDDLLPIPEPKFAKVTDLQGAEWTAIQSGDQWRYLVHRNDPDKRVPHPAEPGEYMEGPLVGDIYEPDLECHTIYLNPDDVERPDGADIYVMRTWVIRAGDVAPTDRVKTASTIEELREQVPWTCIRFPRESMDDPKILETWF